MFTSSSKALKASVFFFLVASVLLWLVVPADSVWPDVFKIAVLGLLVGNAANFLTQALLAYKGPRETIQAKDDVLFRFSIASQAVLQQLQPPVCNVPDTLREHFDRHQLSLPTDAQATWSKARNAWVLSSTSSKNDILYLLKQKGLRIEVFGQRCFTPIGATVRNPLPRQAKVARLSKILSAGGSGVYILVGASGSGKSTLVREFLRPELINQGWRCPPPIAGWPTHELLQSRLVSGVQGGATSHGGNYVFHHGLRSSVASCNSLLIVDQFEEFLSWSTTLERETFKTTLRTLLQDPVLQVLLIVREEFYSELDFLSDFGDLFQRTTRLEGLAVESADPDWAIAKTRLEAVDPGGQVSKLIVDELTSRRELLPLEYVAVGFVLESLNAERLREGRPHLSVEEFRRRYGGCYGMQEEYFRRHIQKTSDPEVAKAVLFAFSSEGRIRRRYRPSDIARITNRDLDTVTRVIRDLNATLLTFLGSDYFVLMHDYLAEAFHRFSGILLDPIDRDNMAVFSDLLTSSPGTFEKLPLVERTGETLWFGVAFAALTVVLAARLLYRFCQPFSDPYAELQLLSPRVIDVLYVPSFFASFFCMCYVRSVFRHFILVRPEGRQFSIIVLAINICMITLGTIEPRLWPVWAGIAGFLIGFRLLCFARAGGNRVARGFVYYVSRLGGYTMLNMVILGVLGVSAYVNFPRWLRGGELFVLDLTFALMVSGFMVVCLLSHATKERGRILAGSLNRVRM